MLGILIVLLIAVVGTVIWTAVVVACTLRVDGGGRICKRCGSLTYANDTACGWCEEFEEIDG